MLPSLVELYALPAEVVLESDLRSRQLDVQQLSRRGFIVSHGRHKVVLIEPDGEGPEEVEVDLADDPESAAHRGPDGLTAIMPAALVSQFKINRPYLEETIADELRPCFERWSFGRDDKNLAFLGELKLRFGAVPCCLARGLEDRRVFERLDVRLRGENSGHRGIVLDAGASGLSFIAGHIVLPLVKHLAIDGDRALDLDAISSTTDLMKDLRASSPQNAFTPERWQLINGIYLEKVGNRSGWRLIAGPSDRQI